MLYAHKPRHVTSLWWLLAPWHIQPKHQLAFIRELHHLKSLLEIQNIAIVTPYSTRQGLLNRYSKYEALLAHNLAANNLPVQVVTTSRLQQLQHDLADELPQEIKPDKLLQNLFTSHGIPVTLVHGPMRGTTDFPPSSPTMDPGLTFPTTICPEQADLITRPTSHSDASFSPQTSVSTAHSTDFFAPGVSTLPSGEKPSHQHINHNDQVEAMDTSDPLDGRTYHDWEDSFILALLGLSATPLEDLAPSFPDLLGDSIIPPQVSHLHQ